MDTVHLACVYFLLIAGAYLLSMLLGMLVCESLEEVAFRMTNSPLFSAVWVAIFGWSLMVASFRSGTWASTAAGIALILFLPSFALLRTRGPVRPLEETIQHLRVSLREEDR